HGFVEALRRDAGAYQPAERLVEGSDLRRGVPVALVGAAAADPVVLLRDVGEVEEVRERARERLRLGDRHLLEDTRERPEVGLAARARLLRERPYPLDQIEDRLAFLPAQRLAQQIAQEPDVFAQSLWQLHQRISLLHALTGRPNRRLAGATRRAAAQERRY